MTGSEPTATCSMGPHGAQVALKPEKSGRLESASFEGDVFGAPHTTVCNVPPVVSDPTSNGRCCDGGVT